MLQFTIHIKRTATRKHNFYQKFMKVCSNFAIKVIEGNSCFAKEFKYMQYRKKKCLSCFFLCASTCVCLLPVVNLDGQSLRVELWLLSLPEAQLNPSSSRNGQATWDSPGYGGLQGSIAASLYSLPPTPF